jgi:hypothetical protein
LVTEALQTIASFKMSQQKQEEALNYLKQAYDSWKNLGKCHSIPSPNFELLRVHLFF